MKYIITAKLEGQTIDRFIVRARSAKQALRKGFQILRDRQWKAGNANTIWPIYRANLTADSRLELHKDAQTLPVIAW